MLDHEHGLYLYWDLSFLPIQNQTMNRSQVNSDSAIIKYKFTKTLRKGNIGTHGVFKEKTKI